MESTKEHSIEAMKPLSAKCNAASFELCAMNTNYGYLAEHLSSPPPCSLSPLLAFHFPSHPSCVLCAQSNDLWAGAKPTPAAAWLQLAANAKKQMQKVHNVWGRGRGEAGRRGNCGSVTGTRSPSAGCVWITIYVKLPI